MAKGTGGRGWDKVEERRNGMRRMESSCKKWRGELLRKVSKVRVVERYIRSLGDCDNRGPETTRGFVGRECPASKNWGKLGQAKRNGVNRSRKDRGRIMFIYL